MKESSHQPRDQRITDSVPYEGTPRRGFLVSLLALIVSIALILIPASLGAVFLLDPVLRRGRTESNEAAENGSRWDADGFIRLDIGVSALPDDGSPLAYSVTDDKTDAWNRYRNVEVGTVWLRRIDKADGVMALSSICPHLGCAVDFRATNQDFYCPCHTSAFSLQGDPLNEIPPRSMDQLETRLKPETGDTIWLKYQKFRATIPEKIPVS